MSQLPPQYQPQPVEERWYAFWDSHGLFGCNSQPGKRPYTIVIPPPNVTGILHMGHALNNTIQDILIRWQRMRGAPTLWVPGTDHAGIATQNVVEKSLAKEGRKRDDVGREAFVARVWQWKEQYGNTIISQLKRLGASCDWSRTRFTMDEGLSKAVMEMFVRLYDDGLIYRGNRIVNWCPRCATALSDEEAPYKTLDGKLYYIRYPLAKQSLVTSRSSLAKKRALLATSDQRPATIRSILVATTRPETMLGDTAIAVNPRDKRYQALIGKEAVLPLVGRRLQIVADEFVDPKFGTGAVKVTPAHDPNDFAMAQRHQLPIINIMTPNGQMEHVPPAYAGQDRFVCRQTVLEDLQQEGLLEKQEAHQHNVGHCYRCDTVIEPRLSPQWFVKMPPLAKPAIDAVKQGKIKFHPARWTKVYMHWMDNIHDWCISRQIWWGHRIPVWYCDTCLRMAESSLVARRSSLATSDQRPATGIIVSRTPPTECPTCHHRELRQDEDVLDTWFSSWLWPLSTLGWPDETEDLNYFYPTSTLVTAQEIIFFWVARMIMAGIYVRKDVPFKDVYIHGTVRDLAGKKMSKSIGNIIDPLHIIEQCGCDALRFSLISAAAVGADVFIGDEKFLVGRNFANKMWNATRFTVSHLPFEGLPRIVPDPRALDLLDRWILSRLQRTIDATTKALAQYRFNDAVHLLYEFFWHDFCDWYVELAKDKLARPETRVVTAALLVHVLEQSLRLLHPIMPFVTEELWQQVKPEGASESIMIAPWPAVEKRFIDAKVERAVTLSQNVVTAVRNIRAEFRIPPAHQLQVHCTVPTPRVLQALRDNADWMARCGAADFHLSRSKQRLTHAATVLVHNIEVVVPLEGIIDLAKERERLKAQAQQVTVQLKGLVARLKDREFLKKAPADIVAKAKERATILAQQQKTLQQSLAALQ